MLNLPGPKKYETDNSFLSQSLYLNVVQSFIIFSAQKQILENLNCLSQNLS